MSFFSELKTIGSFLRNTFKSRTTEEIKKGRASQDVPPVAYKNILFSEKAPRNQDIKANEFWVSSSNTKPQWALFKCPCGCEHVIALPLQHPHKPRWKISQTKNKRPILYPSVWQKTACRSHFWIKDGRIFWVNDEIY